MGYMINFVKHENKVVFKIKTKELKLNMLIFLEWA